MAAPASRPNDHAVRLRLEVDVRSAFCDAVLERGMDVLHRWSTAGGADHEVFAFVLSGRQVVLLVRQVVTASVGTALCDSEIALVGDRELQLALQGQAQSVERLHVGGVGDSDQQGVIVERPHGKSAVSMSEMLWQSKSDFFLDLFVEDVDERQVVLLAECQQGASV